jgi:hypothetical protein
MNARPSAQGPREQTLYQRSRYIMKRTAWLILLSAFLCVLALSGCK